MSKGKSNMSKGKQKQCMLTWAYAADGFYKNPKTKDFYSETEISEFEYKLIPYDSASLADSWYVGIIDRKRNRFVAHSFYPMVGRNSAEKQARLMLRDVKKALIVREEIHLV